MINLFYIKNRLKHININILKCETATIFQNKNLQNLNYYQKFEKAKFYTTK